MPEGKKKVKIFFCPHMEFPDKEIRKWTRLQRPNKELATEILLRDFLVVQWFRLRAPTEDGLGSILIRELDPTRCS